MNKYTEQDILDNMKLVKLVAWKRFQRSKDPLVDYNDMVADGVSGLIHALERFEPERGLQFSTYASKCIWGYILKGNRRLFRERWKAKAAGLEYYTVSIYREDSLDFITKAERIVDGKHELTHYTEIPQMVEKALASLTTRQREVVEVLFRHDFNHTSAAKELGCVKQNVDGVWNYALRRARKALREEM